ncbi:hypothetical protein BGX31_006357 [Mortierella sp. GBA43]|nr:hypothetical protein BGX31_006357 [Mortierella sp. GBA43]
MTYRSEHRRSQYYDMRFDSATLASIRKHMQHKKIQRVQDVWFDNLKWLIENPVEKVTDEYTKLHDISPGNPFSMIAGYNGPIHAVEMMDFFHLMRNYVCIWEAEEGSEFILSEGCFGAYEGHMGICFHNFYVISPRYAIVLVNRLYMMGAMDSLPFRKSWFGEELHANPKTDYKKGPPLRDFDDSNFTPDDVFHYRRILVPKKSVFLVNCIFLDARQKYLTYRSDISMFKSLRHYDKVKETKFDFHHDYTILKRKLFADMNRTHSS